MNEEKIVIFLSEHPHSKLKRVADLIQAKKGRTRIDTARSIASILAQPSLKRRR